LGGSASPDFESVSQIGLYFAPLIWAWPGFPCQQW